MLFYIYLNINISLLLNIKLFMKNNMSNKVLVCKKKEIELYKIIEENKILFELNFNITNKNITVKNVVNFKLFELMAELNKDIIEKQIILGSDKNFIDLLIIFNKFSDDLGMNKQYYSTRTNKLDHNNKTIFSSNNINADINTVKQKYNIDLLNYNLINNSNNNLEFIYLNEHSMNCIYKFNMDLKDDLPIYMENMLGLLMKKVFFRLKTFIENI